MPSKYPSVTAKAKGTAPKPTNFPGGKGLPANDNKIGTVVLSKLKPRFKVGRGWLQLLPDAIDALNAIDDWSDTWWNGIAPLNGRTKFSPLTWNTTPCSACPGGGYGFTGGTSPCCHITTNGNANYANPLGLAAKNQIYRVWSREYPVYPLGPLIPQYRWQVVATAAVKNTAPGNATPVSIPSFAPVPQPQFWPAATPLAEPLVRTRPGALPWLAPQPGQEPSKPENKPDPITSAYVRPVPFIIIVNDLPLGEVSVPRVRRRTGGRPPRPPRVDPVILPPLPVPIFGPPEPKPDALPFVPPGVVVKPSAFNDRMIEIRWTKDFGKQQPPPKGTVEKKANVTVVGGLVWAGLNTLTEIFDFIVAMHKSLPKHMQLSSKASKQDVLAYMMQSSPSEAYDIWKNIDLAEGLENFINMQIGDMAAALGSTPIKKVNQQMGSLTGLDRALREHSDNLGEAGNWSENIPKLDIDRENGVISISGPLGVLTLKRPRVKKWGEKWKGF